MTSFRADEDGISPLNVRHCGCFEDDIDHSVQKAIFTELQAATVLENIRIAIVMTNGD